VTIMFRGREQSRPELGYRLLQRLAGDVEELGFVESSPKQDGRNMIMVIGPHRRKSDAKADRPAQHGDRAASRQRTVRNSEAAAQPANGAGQAEPESTEPESTEPESTAEAEA
jgi:translation initiation factor IF-3